MVTSIYIEKQKESYFYFPVTIRQRVISRNTKTNYHIHPVYHLIFCLEGKGYLLQNNCKHGISPEDIILINPDDEHVFFTSNQDLLLFVFNFYLVPTEGYIKKNIHYHTIMKEYFHKQTPVFSNQILEIIAERRKFYRLFDLKTESIKIKCSTNKWSAVLYEIEQFKKTLKRTNELLFDSNVSGNVLLHSGISFLHQIIRILKTPELSFDSKFISDESDILTMKIREYLGNILYEKYSLTVMAEKLNYNPEYLCKFFKKKKGISIGQYLNKMKIEKACRLLETNNKSITEIAHLLNFSSSQHFAKAFRQEKKISPRDYRKISNLI